MGVMVASTSAAVLSKRVGGRVSHAEYCNDLHSEHIMKLSELRYIKKKFAAVVVAVFSMRCFKDPLATQPDGRSGAAARMAACAPAA
jgi:hypothetical protein